jgi:hypothetical protein
VKTYFDDGAAEPSRSLTGGSGARRSSTELAVLASWEPHGGRLRLPELRVPDDSLFAAGRRGGKSLLITSGRCWARTSDLRLVEAALSQLS